MLWWELDPGSVILQKREQSLELSDATLVAKAEALAADMKLEDFSASKGWADNFKKRHGIRGFRLHGAEAEASPSDDSDAGAKDLPPLVTLDESRAAAAVVARFMAENPDRFSAEQQFSFENLVTAKLSKLLIERFSHRRQQKLTAYIQE